MPGGYSSDSDHLIPRHAPTMPACLTGHALLLLQPKQGEGGWLMGAVGDGHPDYASSYGLFTLDTKQYGKQSIALQQHKTVLIEDASQFGLII